MNSGFCRRGSLLGSLWAAARHPSTATAAAAPGRTTHTLLPAELQHLCLAAQPVAHVATSSAAIYAIAAAAAADTAPADALNSAEDRGSSHSKRRHRSMRHSGASGIVIPQMVAFEHKDRAVHVGSVLSARSSGSSRAKSSQNSTSESISIGNYRSSARGEDVAVGVVGRLVLPPADELALRSRPPVLRTYAVTQLTWADAFSAAFKTRRLLLVVTTDGSIAVFEPALSSNCLALFSANSSAESRSGRGNDRPIAAIRVLSSPPAEANTLGKDTSLGCTEVQVAVLFYDSTLALCSLKVPTGAEAAMGVAADAPQVSNTATGEAPALSRNFLVASAWEQQPLQRWHDATTALDVSAKSEDSSSNSLVAVAGTGPDGGASTSVSVWKLCCSSSRGTDRSGTHLTLLQHVVLHPQLNRRLSTLSPRDDFTANAEANESELATSASAEMKELAALDQCFIPPPLEGDFEETLARRRGAADSSNGVGGGLGAWRSTAVARLSRGAVVACPPIGAAWSSATRLDANDDGGDANSGEGGHSAPATVAGSALSLALVDARGRVRLLRLTPESTVGTQAAAATALELVQDLAPGDAIGDISSSGSNNSSAFSSSSPSPALALGLEGRRWAVVWWSGATGSTRKYSTNQGNDTASGHTASGQSGSSVLVVGSSLGRVTVATAAEGCDGLRVLASVHLPNLLGFSVSNSYGHRNGSLLWTVQPHASGRSGGGALGWLRAQETMAALTASVKRGDFTKALLLCRTISSSSQVGVPSPTRLEDGDSSRDQAGSAEQKLISAELLTAAVHRARWRALLCPRKNIEVNSSEDQNENPIEVNGYSDSGSSRLGVSEDEIDDTLGRLLLVLTSGKVGRLSTSSSGNKSSSSDRHAGELLYGQAYNSSGSSNAVSRSTTANRSNSSSSSVVGIEEEAGGCLWVAWQAWVHCGRVSSMAAAAHFISVGLAAADHAGLLLAATADPATTPANSQESPDAPEALGGGSDALNSRRSQSHEKRLVEAAVLRRALQLRARQWDTSNRAASVWGSALVPLLADVYGVLFSESGGQNYSSSTMGFTTSDLVGVGRGDEIGGRMMRENGFLTHGRATDRTALALFRSMVEESTSLLLSSNNDAWSRGSSGGNGSLNSSSGGALAAARLCAVYGAPRALQVVLIRHPAVTLPHRLALLALLPETVPPAAIAHLLPAAAPAYVPLRGSAPTKAGKEEETQLASEPALATAVLNAADPENTIQKARSYYHYQAGAVVLLPAEWAEEHSFASQLTGSATDSTLDLNSSGSTAQSSSFTSDAWAAAAVAQCGGLAGAVTTCLAQRNTASPADTSRPDAPRRPASGNLQPLGFVGREVLGRFEFDCLARALLGHEHVASSAGSNNEAVSEGDALAWRSRLRAQQANPEQLAQWFLARAAAIDRVGGQAMHAAELLALAWPRVTAARGQQARAAAARSLQRARNKHQKEILAQRTEAAKEKAAAVVHDDSSNSQLSSGSENEEEPSHCHDLEGIVVGESGDGAKIRALSDYGQEDDNEKDEVDEQEDEELLVVIEEGKWVSLLRQADASAGCFVRLLEADCLPPLLELRTWWGMPAVAKLEPVLASLADAGTRALAGGDHFLEGPNNSMNDDDDASKVWDEEVDDVLTLLVGESAHIYVNF